MDELLLELARTYFTKQITPNTLTVIVYNNKQLRELEDTYDSLTLIQKHILEFGVQGVFSYKGIKCPICGNYNYSYGDGCLDCSFNASEIDIY